MNKKLNYIQNLNFKFKFKGKWKRCIFLLHFRIKLTVLLLPGHTDSFVFFSQRKKTASRVLFVYLFTKLCTNKPAHYVLHRCLRIAGPIDKRTVVSVLGWGPLAAPEPPIRNCESGDGRYGPADWIGLSRYDGPLQTASPAGIVVVYTARTWRNNT